MKSRKHFPVSVLALLLLVLWTASIGSPPTIAQPSATPTVESAASLNLVAAANGGRIVSVTDEHDRYPASNLIDGDKLDFGEWWTNEPPAFPQIVVFAFANDTVKTIDRVVLNTWTSEWRYGWVKDFEIYVSDTSADPDDMEAVGEFTLDHVGIDQTFTFDPVPAKYIALVVNSSWGSEEGITLNEFEVYAAEDATAPADPDDLAEAANGGRIADYSSQDPNGKWSPENLIDGDTAGEGWSTDEADTGPHYVVLAFHQNRLYTIDRVDLYSYSGDYPEDCIQSFELRGSASEPDIDTMHVLGRFQLARVDRAQEFKFAPTTLRYLALVALSNYGGTAYALNQIRVYPAADNPLRFKNASAFTRPGSPSAGAAKVTPFPKPPATRGTPASFEPHTLTSGSPIDNILVRIQAIDMLPYVYHLYGEYFDSLVQTTVTNQNTFPVKLRVESALVNYTGAAVKTVTLAPGEQLIIEQNPPLSPGVFETLHEARTAGLHVRIDYLMEGESRLIEEETLSLTVWAQGDKALGLPGYHNGRVFISTMSMPNEPALDDLLREAADYAPGGIITWGYDDETDSEGEVYAKLKAIYDAVAARGVVYVATGIPFVPAEQEEQGLYLQRIKLPYQVLQTRSGMCIELSLLFASAYEKIMLDPKIIGVPGHAYLAVPSSRLSATYYVIETTLVGRASFDEAISVGAQEFDEALPELGRDRYDDYYWLDLEDTRREGILPIPWR